MKITFKEPTLPQEKKARQIYISKFNELRKSGDYVPRAKIIDLMRDLGVWDDESEKTLETARKRLGELLEPLDSGGIPLSEMKERAEKAQEFRAKINLINIAIFKYQAEFSIEHNAEQARDDYLMCECARDEEGNKIFNSVEDMYACEDPEKVDSLYEAYNNHRYGSNDETFQNIPENKFLIEYGFLDKDFMNAKPEPKEFKPFLDEEGNPVSNSEDKKPTRKKKAEAK